MVLPNISERLHYRLIPGTPSEYTSTIVLTSKDSHYIDVRISLSKWASQRSQESQTPDCIDWAFAGRSRTQKDPKTSDGPGARSHTVWDHWIDSHGDDAAADEGNMTVLDDGTVLEEGVNVKEDGTEEKYEELWRDLPIDPLGRKGNRHSIVLRTEDEDDEIRGLVIKIGGWCQGILRREGALTVERWELRPRVEGAADQGVEERTRTKNDWVRTFKVGKGTLACKDVCEHTTGKLGMNVLKEYGVGEERLEWKVVEEYYW